MNVAYLYCIEFPNRKKYIGMARHPWNRFAEHKRQARIGSMLPVHRAIRKYGEESISLTILLEGSRSYIQLMEIKTIEEFQTKSHAKGYNITNGGDGGTLGLKASDVTKRKMSLAHKGRRQRPEWIAKRTGKQVGSRRSDESRKRMSEGQRKRVRRPEENERLRTVRKGAVFTSEHRAKLRESALAREAQKRQTVNMVNGRTDSPR